MTQEGQKGQGAFTPGPWCVVIDDDGNPLSGRPGVFAPDELDCAIVHWEGFVQPYWRSARGDKEIHANARLIAAAPELLEALVEAEQRLRYSGDRFHDVGADLRAQAEWAAADKAAAAILKATRGSL